MPNVIDMIITQAAVTIISVLLSAALSVEEIREYWDAAGMYPPEKLMPYFETGTQEYVGALFNYQLFKPVINDGPYPLIVWMHGYGDEEFSQDNAGQLRHLGYFFKSINPEEHNFYLLAMQVPKPPGNWFRGNPQPAEALADLIKQLIERYPIDKNRIHLIGVSGGPMVMEMALRHPKIFASIVPISSTKCEYSRLRSILDIPVWAFHRRDDKPPVSGVREMVDQINQLGGRAHLTVFPGSNHDAWRPAFRSCDLLNWLLSQERGGRSRRSPGHLPWKWWQIVGQICLPAIIGFASIAAFARSNRRNSWLRRHWPSALLVSGISLLVLSILPRREMSVFETLDVRTWSASGWRVVLIGTTLWLLFMFYLLRATRHYVRRSRI
jgi:predicted esterase